MKAPNIKILDIDATEVVIEALRQPDLIELIDGARLEPDTDKIEYPHEHENDWIDIVVWLDIYVYPDCIELDQVTVNLDGMTVKNCHYDVDRINKELKGFEL